MAEQDAKRVKELLERTQEAARPLKDNKLNEKLDAAKKHLVERMEPQKRSNKT